MKPDDLVPGSTIGDFRITGSLGRGGMGAVYRAVGPTGAEVALKVMIGEDVRDLVFRERFKREAAAARAIQHENVVHCLGAGESRGVLWIALELVSGGSLSERARRGPVPWREAAALGAGIARALAAIHGAGLVHRDLKPANVLLDAAGTPKVTDFGIARDTKQTGHALTRTNEIVGTPEYLAPEQIDAARSVDSRADLYSLGVLLFALVSGAPPFRGSPLQVMSAHTTQTPPLLGAVVKGVPEDLESLVARLLAKNAAERGASAESVARELEAIAAGRSRSRRSGAGVVLALGALALVAAGATVAFLAASGGAPPPATPPSVAKGAPPSPPPPPSKPSEPAWFLALPAEKRPPALPSAIAFGKEPNEYVSVVDTSLVLVYVPGGEFVMGDEFSPHASERPGHRVRVSPFFLGKYEVTIGQFRRFVEARRAPLPRASWGYLDRTPRPKGDGPPSREEIRKLRGQHRTWDHPYDPDDFSELPAPPEVTDRHPVTQIMPRDALEFAERLGLDLPTEAQWEYAGSWDPVKGEKRRFAWGQDVPGPEPRFANLANLIDISLTKIKRQSPVFGSYVDGCPTASKVGAFPRDRSPAEAYDMTGNVREICRDFYDEELYARWGDPAKVLVDPECREPPPSDKEGVRVLRGGSWGWHTGTLAMTTRDPCEFASDVVGFRVALRLRAP